METFLLLGAFVINVEESMPQALSLLFVLPVAGNVMAHSVASSRWLRMTNYHSSIAGSIKQEHWKFCTIRPIVYYIKKTHILCSTPEIIITYIY